MADTEECCGGQVPEELREELRGLRATPDNDVADGSLEDGDPLSLAGDLIEDPD